MHVKTETEAIDNTILEASYNWIFFIDDYA